MLQLYILSEKDMLFSKRCHSYHANTKYVIKVEANDSERSVVSCMGDYLCQDAKIGYPLQCTGDRHLYRLRSKTSHDVVSVAIEDFSRCSSYNIAQYRTRHYLSDI